MKHTLTTKMVPTSTTNREITSIYYLINTDFNNSQQTIKVMTYSVMYQITEILTDILSQGMKLFGGNSISNLMKRFPLS